MIELSKVFSNSQYVTFRFENGIAVTASVGTNPANSVNLKSTDFSVSSETFSININLTYVDPFLKKETIVPYYFEGVCTTLENATIKDLIKWLDLAEKGNLNNTKNI